MPLGAERVEISCLVCVVKGCHFQKFGLAVGLVIFNRYDALAIFYEDSNNLSQLPPKSVYLLNIGNFHSKVLFLKLKI